jgi:hypothetical protein
MTRVRIIAILVGFAITFSLQMWLNVSWYIAIPIAVLGYVLARYIGGMISERRPKGRTGSGGGESKKR